MAVHETRDDLWGEKAAKTTFLWLVLSVVLFAIPVFLFILLRK